MSLSLWKVTQLALDTAKRVLKAQLRGAGSTGDDDSAESYDDAEVIFPIGFIGYPDTQTNGDTLEALCDEAGDEVMPVALLNKSMAAYSPAAVAGETRIYGAKNQAAMVRLLDTGETQVLADAANSKVVTLGDVPGTTKFLIGDQEALRTWCSSVEAMLNDIKAQFNQLRTDYNALATANCVNGSPVTFLPAHWPTSATAISESNIGDPPALSSKVKAI